MIDSNQVIYFLDNKKIFLTAVVTDTYFDNVPNSSLRIQVSDIDVEIEQEYLNESAGIIPLDCNGFAVTPELKSKISSFIDNSENLFRKMTVDGKENILWQLHAPSAYKILNDNLELSPNSDVFRGPFNYRGSLSASSLELSQTLTAPIGCLFGREDYQELIFSKELYKLLCNDSDLSSLFIELPLYNEDLLNIINGKFDIVKEDYFDCLNPKYLKILREKELLALLKFASYKDNLHVGLEIYNTIKALNLPLSTKKEAMTLYKALKNRRVVSG